jgi:hypothetical protein
MMEGPGGPLRDPAVKKELENFVELWLHYDHHEKGTENIERQKEILGFQAYPYWVIYDPATKKALRKRAFTMSVEVFLKFLRGE